MEKFIQKLKDWKTWMTGMGLGTVAIFLYWIIKIIICFFLGICII